MASGSDKQALKSLLNIIDQADSKPPTNPGDVSRCLAVSYGRPDLRASIQGAVRKTVSWRLVNAGLRSPRVVFVYELARVIQDHLCGQGLHSVNESGPRSCTSQCRYWGRGPVPPVSGNDAARFEEFSVSWRCSLIASCRSKRLWVLHHLVSASLVLQCPPRLRLFKVQPGRNSLVTQKMVSTSPVATKEILAPVSLPRPGTEGVEG